MNATEPGGSQDWGEYLSYRDAERYTGLSRTTLWRILRRSEIDAVQVGTAVRLNRASIDRYLRDHAWGDGADG